MAEHSIGSVPDDPVPSASENSPAGGAPLDTGLLPDEPADESVDGRTLRRTRNRGKVIVALLELVNEGRLDPNVADIADRAGVSHRSVFRYFNDINDLVRTAITYEVRRVLPLAAIEDIGNGTLEHRIGEWADSRMRIYAAAFQVSRVARIRASTIPSIDDGMRAINDAAGEAFRQNFATELEHLGSDRDLAVDAAMILTSFESYDLEIRLYQHDVEHIRRVWTFGLHALFASSNSES